MKGGDGFLKDLPVGIVENALMHTDSEPLFDLKTKFKMVRDAVLFDYIDADPPAELLRTDRELGARYAGPIRGYGYIYQVIRDEAMMERHLHVAASLGSTVLNVQILRYRECGSPGRLAQPSTSRDNEMATQQRKCHPAGWSPCPSAIRWRQRMIRGA